VEHLEVVRAACSELQGCAAFTKLLQAVLELGNHLNQGTQRGAAAGFRLDTLLKLADVKGTDRKTSLLHFVIMQARRGVLLRLRQAALRWRQRGPTFQLQFSHPFELPLTARAPPLPEQLVEEDEGMKRMSEELGHLKQAANMQVGPCSGTQQAVATPSPWLPARLDGGARPA
jgi:hypothetical protein